MQLIELIKPLIGGIIIGAATIATIYFYKFVFKYVYGVDIIKWLKKSKES